MPSLKVIRARNVEKLLTELDDARKRLLDERAQKPLLDMKDFGYFLDGSNDRGGQEHHRQWQICRISGRMLFFYEDSSPWGIENPEMIPLLLNATPDDNRHRVNYGCVGLENLVDDGSLWSLDNLIRVRKKLKRFYTPRDLARRVKKFTKHMAHEATVAYLSA